MTDPLPGQTSIGVVIIGRNEGERLRVCLESVLGMDYPRSLLDVVYVDSSSSDDSVELARSLGVSTVVLNGPTTAARGRNAGWSRVAAPYVLFLDGDTVLHPHFVRKALAQFADPSVAGVWGDRRESRTADSIYNAMFDLDWNQQPGFSLFFGGDALVRRDALAAVGGYNEQLIAGEEPELCRRMRERGYRILHVSEPMTMHDLAMHRFAQYWRRSIRTGYAYAEVSSMYSSSADPLWRADSRRNVVRGLFWMMTPPLSIAASLRLRSPLPFAAFLLGGGLLWLRTFRRSRSLTARLPLRLAYAAHSHLQQVPILLGQLRFWFSRMRGHRSAIIEYRSTQ